MVYLNWRYCLYFNLVYWKSFADDLLIIYTWMNCQSYFLVMLLINYQSFTNLIPVDYQCLLMQFLCSINGNCLPNICQSTSSFYSIAHVVAITTNYYNLLYQSFTNHYQSDSVLYISSLAMITNNLLIHHYQS